jgi:hypothetical protein
MATCANAKGCGIPHFSTLLNIAWFLAVLLSAGCGDRGGGYIVERGAAGPGPGPVIDMTPPSVLSTNPSPNDSSVPINAAISVSFSESIAPATVTNATFMVKDAANAEVSGSLNCNGANVTFTPSSWLSVNTSYTVTLSSGITDLYGNHLTGTFQWAFTTNSQTDPVPPTIVAAYPASGQADVVLTTAITVTFSESMDPATFTASTIKLWEAGNVPLGTSLSVTGSTLVIAPTSSLKFYMNYAVCIYAGVADLAGNTLPSNHCWNFSTVDNSGYFKPYVAIPTASWPESVAIGDVTGDGTNDVALVTTSDYHVYLFAQDGQGGLATAATSTISGSLTGSLLSVAIGDINNDGKNEIVVGHDRSEIEIFSYSGTGALSSLATYTSADTTWIRIADLNNDGLLDVVGIGWGTDTASVFLQNAQGTLDPPAIYDVTHAGWDDLEVGDINNDGLTDIIVMSGQYYAYPNIGILKQKATGTFDAAVYYNLGGDEMADSIGIGDVDGDSLNDIALSAGNGLAVFPQHVSGMLDAPVRYAFGGGATALEVRDINADGRQDAVLMAGGVRLCLQNENGLLTDCEFYYVPSADFSGHAMAIGDISSDGKPDIVVADSYEGLVILYHQ